MQTIEVGDVVISTAGRDANKAFLVIAVENGYALIVDGKTRKVATPKKKNLKHVKKAKADGLKDLSQKILRGEPVSNAKLKKQITLTMQEKITGGKVCV